MCDTGQKGSKMSIEKNESFTLTLHDITENEDGSATYSFDLDHGAHKLVGEIGLQFLLYCAVLQVSTDEAFDILLKSKPEEETEND